MTLNGWLQIALFCAIVVALARPLGGWLTRILDGAPTAFERPLYHAAGVNPNEEQGWLGYAFALLAFGVVPQSSCSFNPQAPPRICSSSPAGSAALPLPRKPRFTPKLSAA